MSLPLQSSAQTILLVEQDLQLLIFVRTVLEKASFMVLSASTAEEALRIEAEFTGAVDLLITAFTLPRLSASGLAEELQRRRPGLKVMLLSSHPDALTLAISHGWYFIGKPFEPSAFLSMTRAAIGRDLTNVESA